jgi:hypothetical protein
MKQPPDIRGSTVDGVHDLARTHAEQQIEIETLRSIVLELMEDHRQLFKVLDEARRSCVDQAREIDALRQLVTKLTTESAAFRPLRDFIRKCARLTRRWSSPFRNGSFP